MTGGRSGSSRGTSCSREARCGKRSWLAGRGAISPILPPRPRHRRVCSGPGRRSPVTLRARTRQAAPCARRHAVLDQFTVLALEAETDPFGDDVGDGWSHDDGDAAEPGRPVELDVEEARDQVVAAEQPQHTVEGDAAHAHCGTGGCVAWSVHDMMLPFIPRNPLLKERVQSETRDQQPEDKQPGNEYAEAEAVAQEVDLPGRHHPQRTLQPAHVEVRLRAC